MKERRERRESGGAQLRKAFTRAADRAHCVLSERPHQILHSKKTGDRVIIGDVWERHTHTQKKRI